MNGKKNTGMILLGGVMVLLALIWLFGLAPDLSGNAVPSRETCLSPTVHNGGLTGFWDHVVKQTGIDDRSAALTMISIEISPDDAIKSIFLQFYAKKNGQDRHYSVEYHNSTGNCGRVSGTTYTDSQPDFTHRYPQHPRNFLRDIEETPFGELGLTHENVIISTDNGWGRNSYSSQINACNELYLLQNGTLQHLLLLSFEDETVPHFPRIFFIMNCTATGPGSSSCHSDRSINIFSGDRPWGTKIIYDTQQPAMSNWKRCPPATHTECNEIQICTAPDQCQAVSSGCRTTVEPVIVAVPMPRP
jgi:hypothetical protein